MNHPRLREQAPSSPGVIPLTCAAIRRVRGSYFDLGNEIDHLFSPYQLKPLTRHSDPGYNVLQLRFYRTFTSSGTFKPKKCCHQHKQPGQINAAENHPPATRASGSSFASIPGARDQHIPRWTGRSALTSEEEPQERPKIHGTTCTPSVRAEPMMVLAIASSRRCLRCSSAALIFAISYTCLRLTVPIVSWPGRPVPFSMPAAFFRKYDTVGVFVTKVKDRSGWMVITVGIGTPGEIWAVRALNSLQKSIDRTPRAPRAGPTGGVGAALPAAMRRRCRQGLAEIELI
jgi:hypothetical protein